MTRRGRRALLKFFLSPGSPAWSPVDRRRGYTALVDGAADRTRLLARLLGLSDRDLGVSPRRHRGRVLLVSLLALVGSTLLVRPALAQTTTSFVVAAVGENGEPLTSGRCRVYTDDTATDATDLFSDPALATSTTSPLTLDTTKGTCTWYSSQSATSAKYDVLIVIDSGSYKGGRARLNDVTRTGLKTAKFSRQNPEKVLMIPFTTTTVASGPTATTYKIPAGSIVTNAFVETTTKVTNSTIQVGLPSTSGATVASTEASAVYCSAIDTSVVNYFQPCAPTAPTTRNGLIHGSTAFAVTYSTQGHATAGFIWVYYLEGANDTTN